jgi:hypothetical protein
MPQWRAGGEGRHCIPLTPADLTRLPRPDCDLVADHEGWARSAFSEYGFCGLGCVDARNPGRLSGYVLVSPALHIPRVHPLAIGANGDAAALLAVGDDGCGKRLVQALAARLAGQRAIVAIDAAASATGHACAPSYAWLDSVGFRPIEADPSRYRLELNATRSWLPDLSGFASRLRTLIRPAPPEPVGRYERARRSG